MPIIIEWTFKDSSKETDRIAVQVWRKNENQVIKTFMKDKEVAYIRLDPMKETADINEQNNVWFAVNTPDSFQLLKTIGNIPPGTVPKPPNPMQKEIKK